MRDVTYVSQLPASNAVENIAHESNFYQRGQQKTEVIINYLRLFGP